MEGSEIMDLLECLTKTPNNRDALHQTRGTRGVQKAFSPGAFQHGIPAPWPSRETSFFTQTQWEDERMGQGSARGKGGKLLRTV